MGSKSDNLDEVNMDEVLKLIEDAQAIIQQNKSVLEKRKPTISKIDEVRRQVQLVMSSTQNEIVVSEASTSSINLSPVASNSNRNNTDDDVIYVNSHPGNIIDLCNSVTTPSAPARTSTPVPRRQKRRARQQPTVQLNTSPNEVVNLSDCIYVSPPKSRKLKPEEDAGMNDSGTVANGSPLKCPICLESSAKKEPTSTVCGHIFCNMCIRGAILATHKCPICCKKLTQKSIFRLYI